MVVQSFVRTDVSLSNDRKKKNKFYFYFNYWRVLNARAISFPGNCLGGDSRNAVCGKGHLKYCINWWASGLRYVGPPPPAQNKSRERARNIFHHDSMFRNEQPK